MAEVRIKTLTGDSTTLAQDALNDLRSRIRGTILLPADAGYDEARQIWNAMVDRKPALIARCTGTVDVMQAVRFAKSHNLLVSIRGAGHNIAGKSIHDGAMLIDLSQMRTVRVDPDARIAVVSPGATLGDLDHETQRNFISDGEERVDGAYGANYDKLARVKAVYDPENFFRLNQNIVPRKA